MAKRIATRDLNHDNWDKEEEPEEVGTFHKADDEVLRSRVIKTAKRRATGSPSGDAGPAKNPFASFTGFGSANSTPVSAKIPFAFLSKSNNEPEVKKFNTDFNKAEDKTLSNNIQNTSPCVSKTSDKKSQNLESLKDLNLSCSKWIIEHLQKNPYCILTPIFNDYEKHLSKLDLETDGQSKVDGKVENNIQKSVPVEVTKTFSFTAMTKPAEVANASVLNDNSQNKKLGSFPAFQFKSDTSTLGSGTGLLFGSGAAPSFSFTNIAQKPVAEGNEETKQPDGDEAPPKNDFVPVIEEDSIYDTKCKVFVKKDGDFKSRGVGTLFLKSVSEGKTQLIVRADTNLGNILLNMLLSPGIPLHKMGQNNVMTVCLPTPDCSPPPVPVLIRVKTTEDRDKLLAKLEEHRK